VLLSVVTEFLVVLGALRAPWDSFSSVDQLFVGYATMTFNISNANAVSLRCAPRKCIIITAGYCFHCRLSICLSVHMSVFSNLAEKFLCCI